jgi:hypothetical protein
LTNNFGAILLLIGILITAPLTIYHAFFILGDKTTIGNGTATVYYDVNTSSIVMNYTDIRNDTRAVTFSVYVGDPPDIVFSNTSTEFPVDVRYTDVDYNSVYSIKIKSDRETGNYTYMAQINPSEYGGGIHAIFNEIGGVVRT